VDQFAGFFRPHLLDGADISARMRSPDRIFDIVAQRRLVANEVLIDLMSQHLVDGAHPVRPLGMRWPGIMIDERRVGDEECCHDRVLQ
jgi:hypothetical protein